VSTGRKLAYLQQQHSIAAYIRLLAQHPRIAIHLDGKPKAADLPPEGDVPGHRDHRGNRHEEQVRVPCTDVLAFVLNYHPLGFLVSRKHPLREHDLGAEESDDGRPRAPGDQHRGGCNHLSAPVPATPVHAYEEYHQAREHHKRAEQPEAKKQIIELLENGELSVH
jgi:hypothetical protein